MDSHVVVSIEDRLRGWRELESAASTAEEAVRGVGQAAADPRAAHLFREAKDLRERSDREFAAIMRAVKLDEPKS
ncbi:MAG TPA: hypothetical protein VLJ86_22885 [Ramlibacter sp.]|nr:hypothetical protein [Ramlibacter sp.]